VHQFNWMTLHFHDSCTFALCQKKLVLRMCKMATGLSGDTHQKTWTTFSILWRVHRYKSQNLNSVLDFGFLWSKEPEVYLGCCILWGKETEVSNPNSITDFHFVRSRGSEIANPNSIPDFHFLLGQGIWNLKPEFYPGFPLSVGQGIWNLQPHFLLFQVPIGM